MKKHLFILITFFLAYSAKTQVVFCPPGAQWSYNFFWSAGGFPGGQYSMLEKITYDRDSVMGANTVKVLRHGWFYLECGGMYPGITLIKQNGDTVFMRNVNTNHNWEILYNFNVQQGDVWQTTVKAEAYNTSNLSYYTYTIAVDSVKFIVENGFNLKRLYVKYSRPGQFGIVKYSSVITERFGCSTFLFNYYNNSYGACDGDWFQRFLCYKDNQFGTKQFTSYACDHFTTVGINEHQQGKETISLYPNPANTLLTLEFEGKSVFENLEVQLISITGQKLLTVKPTTLYNSKIELDLSSFQQGLYFIKVFAKGQLLATEKFIKE